MGKQEKKVNVKAYRTKEGKRVRPFSRRQKVLAGAAVGGSVLGLVAAVKNKKAIGNLIKDVKDKRLANNAKNLDFSIPKDATVPSSYDLDNAKAFKISAVEFNIDKKGTFSRHDAESSKVMMSSKENRVYSESFEKGVSGYFITKFDEANKNKSHLINIFVNTKEKDFANRDVPAIISMELDANTDPRGIDLPAIKGVFDSDERLRKIFKDRKSRELSEDEINYVTTKLKKLPSAKNICSSGLVNLRGS
jgi:hypothetical protein